MHYTTELENSNVGGVGSHIREIPTEMKWLILKFAQMASIHTIDPLLTQEPLNTAYE